VGLFLLPLQSFEVPTTTDPSLIRARSTSTSPRTICGRTSIFPRPAFLEAFEASPSGKALEDLGLKKLVAGWHVDVALAQLDQVLAELPIHVDP